MNLYTIILLIMVLLVAIKIGKFAIKATVIGVLAFIGLKFLGII